MSDIGSKTALKSAASILPGESLAPTPDIQAVWDAVYANMRSEFGEAVFRSWLKHLTLQAFYAQSGTMEVSAPTRFMREWVENHYSERLLELCQDQNAKVKQLKIVVVAASLVKPEQTASSAPNKASRKSNENLPGKTAAKVLSPEIKGAIEELSSPLDPRFTFDTFVVGQPNALAHAAARRVVESKTVPFNPLFIYGGVGLGKTHLMHAIAAAVRDHQPEKQVLYLSAEKFMYHFVRALRRQDMMSFKEQLRSVDILMVDDIQFISGKETTQEEFFHTFNALVDQNKQIVISADKPPSDLAGLEERLRSRLSWGLTADIHPSTYDLRLGILKSKCAQMETEVPETVLEFLALKVTSSIRELEGALNRIAAHSEVTGQPVRLESTQEVLQDLLRAHDRRITIDEIQRKVAEHFNLKINDMHSVRRSRNVARPRQIAMYLSKQLTPRSLPEIGRKFGGRDHTTVMHAVRKVEELMESDTQIAQDVDVIRRALTG